MKYRNLRRRLKHITRKNLGAEKMNDDLLHSTDEELRKILSSSTRNEGQIFNRGVKLGRHLERAHLPDVKLDYFEEKEIHLAFRDEIAKINDEINARLLRLVKLAIRDQIRESRWKVWEFDANSSANQLAMLDLSIVHKRHIQFVDAQEISKDIAVAACFELTGKLRDLFESHAQAVSFYAVFEDIDGNNRVQFTKEEQLHAVQRCNLEIKYRSVEESYKSLKDLFTEFDKTTILLLIE